MTKLRAITLAGWALILALIWTVVMVASYSWSRYQAQTLLLDQARAELRASFFKDQTFRLWATGHGGVYVPVTDKQQPDPYVGFLPERDVVTTSGRVLTLINPALMVRQFNELAREQYAMEGNLTGVRPLNPINTPDAWEAKAYEAFQRGIEEVSEVSTLKGAPYLRLIRPMYMTEPCLKCHAHQGFKVGDLAGGVSVSVPLEPVYALMERQIVNLTGGHITIWLLGMVGIFFGQRQIVSEISARESAYVSLEESEAKTRAIISSSLDAIVSIDCDGNVMSWNDQASSMFGWQAGEVLGRPLSESIIPERFREAHRQGLARAAENREGRMLNRRVEIFGLRRTGEEFPLELSVISLNIDGQRGFSAFMRDISEKRQAEKQIERDYGTQQLLSSVLRISLEPTSFAERLDKILREVLSTHWLKLQGSGAIFVVAADGGRLEMMAHCGMREAAVAMCAEISLGECLCGKAATSGKVVWKDGVDADHHRCYEGMSEHGHYCVPIQTGERLLGVFNLYLEAGHPYDEDEITLLSAVSHTIGNMIQRHEIEQSLLFNAYHDELTGLPNRLLFNDRLQHCMARFARQGDGHFAVLFLDLDRFKVVNDSLGHNNGDTMLIDVANRLKGCCRPDDTVARMGGDEFTILLEDIGSPIDVSHISDRIHEAFEQPFLVDRNEIHSSCSIGVAFGGGSYTGPEELLRDADTAMYRAKQVVGPSTVYFDEQMHTTAMERLRIESRLRQALERGELAVYYQPIVAAGSGEILGFEALARWPQEDGTMVPPGIFIPVAEETGLINELGLWVLRTACHQLRDWQARFPDLYVSVNLSGKQLLQGELFEAIETILDGIDFDPRHLCLEITESTLVNNSAATSALLERFRAHGYRFYIDDFGTGYSSLSYLHSFPFEALKIDRSFVGNLARGSEHVNMIETIISIAHNFGMEVIAEGVELSEQRDELCRLGCERLQGYLLSHPLPADQIPPLLAAGKC